MTRTLSSSSLRRRLSVAALVTSAAVIVAAPSIVKADQGSGSSTHAQPSAQDQQLAKQVEELRAQVARLQAALDQQRPSAPSASTHAPAQPSASGMPMGEMGKMGTAQSMPKASMGMMDMHQGEMGAPPEGMKMPDGMMMDEMGGMAGMSGSSGMAAGATPKDTSREVMPPRGGMNMGGGTGSAATPGRTAPRSMSSLPGVPGASHLYHIGSTGFFLDQPQISFTLEQQNALNSIKERALLERGKVERRLEQAEQELWALTGTDQPDAATIQAKAKEIEQLRTSQRLAFIQAVGEATKLLTPEQRNQLLGKGHASAK